MYEASAFLGPHFSCFFCLSFSTFSVVGLDVKQYISEKCPYKEMTKTYERYIESKLRGGPQQMTDTAKFVLPW